MQGVTEQIAHTLKTMRKVRGWSLAHAAQHTGVSKAMLGQIERGESSPTVATLWKIASGMNVAFSAFLEDQGTAGWGGRRSEAPVFLETGGGMRVVSLFPFDPALGFEMFIVDLAPGTRSVSSPHARGVVEHVAVIEGVLALTVDGVAHRLTAGQGIRFAADCQHSYHNPNADRVRFHDLIHYPELA
ncbi:XRE family transcriptional regulator [Sodalis endosymbiont of Spalangia cameroni]|uniref:helix-turn-helix domain-containing protein n=1 Tax=Sodalis praecaptivus TaxID=1239307 RepID=UPI0031F756A4